MNPAEMTGLQIMQAFAAGKIPPPSISKTMPMNPVSVAFGEVVFEATADDRHINPLGGVHGGFAATVLDSVTGCATHTVLEAGVSYGTVDLNVKMVRPVPKNVTLIAQGRVINQSKRLVISEGDIKGSDGKLYAHATCSCMVIYPSGE